MPPVVLMQREPSGPPGKCPATLVQLDVHLDSLLPQEEAQVQGALWGGAVPAVGNGLRVTA